LASGKHNGLQTQRYKVKPRCDYQAQQVPLCVYVKKQTFFFKFPLKGQMEQKFTDTSKTNPLRFKQTNADLKQLTYSRKHFPNTPDHDYSFKMYFIIFASF